MRRLLSIPRPESKAILKTVRVQEEAEAEAAVVAAEAAVRVEVKAGMIRVRAVMIVRAAITREPLIKSVFVILSESRLARMTQERFGFLRRVI